MLDLYEVENDLPWDYEKIVREYLANDMQMMDYDTGGGEFLLSLEHPFEKTFATEGYAPNVEICREKLLPLGINFKECNNPNNIPFEEDSFDIMINRHGGFVPIEIYRLLRKNGVFITEQVGGDNEIQIKCEKAGISFFAGFAIANSEKGTKYYYDGILTGSEEITLADDRIERHICVANGFEVRPKNVVLDISEDEEIQSYISDMDTMLEEEKN